METPNTAFQDTLSHNTSEESREEFSYILGENQSEEVVHKNLSSTPHLLIAGATGTGKSTLAHAILLSLLKNTSPDKLSVLLCDTKMIEFSNYQSTPHLIAPVLTDSEKIQGAVMWASAEMTRRLRLVSSAGYRSMEAYNTHMAECDNNELPRILLLIDDVVSAMHDAKAWAALQNLAQSGRSAGIHLILITQTPSDKRISGIIKSSISARAVFNVFSNADEKLLLGSSKNSFLSDVGEIIFCTMPSRTKERIRCYAVTDTDISAVLSEVKLLYPQSAHKVSISAYPMPTILDVPEELELEGDNLLVEAVDQILESGQASVSMLQRQLKVGYARAARILDEMEEKGIVGPFCGSAPRMILITKAQWDNMKNGEIQESLFTLAYDDVETQSLPPEHSEPEVLDTLVQQHNSSDPPSMPAVAEASEPAQQKRSWLSSVLDSFRKRAHSKSVQDTIYETHIITTNSQLDAFEKEHPLLDEIYTKVVGVTYPNDDGSSRQRILSHCHSGDEVIFHPFIYEGDPALAVHTKYGQIGNLSADLASRFEYDYGCDLILCGTITEVTGGSDGMYFGCNLLIKAYKA